MNRRAVAGAFLAHLAVFGPAYSYGVLAVPLTRELGLSAWEYSLVGGLATTLYLVFSGLTGRLADRVGATRPICAGAVLVGAGLGLTALAGNLLVLLAGYVVLFGAGVSLCFVPSLAAVAHTRPLRPSLAAGIAASGAGMGTLLIGPGMALLIDRVGWRPAVALLGGAAMLLLFAAAALVGEYSGVGESPDVDLGPATNLARVVLVGMVLVGFGYYVPFVQLVPALVDSGRSLSDASAFLLVLGIASLGGRLLLAGVGDRGAPQKWLAVAVAGMALGCLLLAVLEPIAVVVGVALFGATAGAFVAFVPSVAASLVGPERAGAQTGRFYTGLATGAALGPVTAGWIASGDAGYAGAFAGAGIMLAAGGMVSAYAVTKKREEHAVPAVRR